MAAQTNCEPRKIDKAPRRLACGDDTVFQTIARRYRDRLIAVALGVVRDRESAEDVAQETLLVAWTSLIELREPTAVRAWLSSIARNKAKMVVRKRSREALCGAPEESGHHVDETGSSPLDHVCDRQLREHAAGLLHQLPPRYRVPLVLFYCHARSVKEIARQLGTSDDAVKQRLSRGRRKLRCLARQDGTTTAEILAIAQPAAA